MDHRKAPACVCKLHLHASGGGTFRGVVACMLLSHIWVSRLLPGPGSPYPGQERGEISLVTIIGQTKKKDLTFTSYLKHRDFVTEAIKEDLAETEKGILLVWCSGGNRTGSILVLHS